MESRNCAGRPCVRAKRVSLSSQRAYDLRQCSLCCKLSTGLDPYITRRRVLKTLAALGLGRFAAGSPSLRRIDVHHHFRVAGMKGVMPEDGWTPARSIEQMNKYGIATAIVSTPTLMDLYDGTERASGLARTYNEYAAKMVQDYPGRFGFFACLPFPDQQRSLHEIEYAFDTLKADGIGLFTNTGDKWPGDPAFEPVFQELNRRNAAVFFHPVVGSCCRNLIPGVADTVLEFDFDTTRAVTSLLANGTLSRFPNVRFIINHSGADVPVMAGRIKDRIADHAERYPQGVLYELQKLHYEVAHATYPWPLAALTKFVPTSQILFGSDYPFEAIGTTVDPLPTSGLSRNVLRAINRGNAERLFPRLKSL
jgi:6-methylsalicylate decarboxylase